MPPPLPSPPMIDEDGDDVLQKFNFQNNKIQNDYGEVCDSYRGADGDMEKIQLKKADENDKLIVSDGVAEMNKNYCFHDAVTVANNYDGGGGGDNGDGGCQHDEERYEIGKNEKSNNQHQCTLLSSSFAAGMVLGTIKSGVDNEQQKSEKLIESHGDGGGGEVGCSDTARWRPAGSENKISKVCAASSLHCPDYNCNHESGDGGAGKDGISRSADEGQEADQHRNPCAHHHWEKEVQKGNRQDEELSGKNFDGIEEGGGGGAGCDNCNRQCLNDDGDGDEALQGIDLGSSGDDGDFEDDLSLQYWKHKAARMSDAKEITTDGYDGDTTGGFCQLSAPNHLNLIHDDDCDGQPEK